jgi:hypothetical protein
MSIKYDKKDLMKFELINKTTKEVVDTVDLSDVWLNGAKTYFRHKNKLEVKDFDNTFTVKQYEAKRTYRKV